MMQVLVMGQHNWASQIAAALDAHATDTRAVYVPQAGYLRLLVRPPRQVPTIIMRVGYRVGGATPRARLFDAYWGALRRSFPEAAACHYWLGTDVLNTLEDALAGTLRTRAVAATIDDLHIAAAPWLVTELQSVGIDALMAYAPVSFSSPDVMAPLPPDFRVLTYLPSSRFAFYGGETILEVARLLPHVRFDVVGATESERLGMAPPNVVWHGWVTDMAKAYGNTTVVVRIPRHDAVGGSVVEGLLHGRHVIGTHELPFVRAVWPVTVDGLRDAIADLYDKHVRGELQLNLAGRVYARQEFDIDRNAERVVALLRTIS